MELGSETRLFPLLLSPVLIGWKSQNFTRCQRCVDCVLGLYFFFFFWEPLTFRCSGPFFAKTENVGRGQRSCDSEVELMNRSHTDDGEASQDAKMGARDLQLLLTLHSASCLSLLSSQITHLLGAREWGCLGGSEPRVHLLPLCLLAPFCSWLSAIGVKAGDNQEGDFPGPGSAEVGPIEG